MKLTGAFKGSGDFRKLKPNVEKNEKRGQSFDGRQARLAKVGGVKLKAIPNKGDRVGVAPEIKQIASVAVIQIALMRNAQYGSKRKKSGRTKD